MGTIARTCPDCKESFLPTEEFFYVWQQWDKKRGRYFQCMSQRCRPCERKRKAAVARAKYRADANYREKQKKKGYAAKSRYNSGKPSGRTAHFTDGQIHRIRNRHAAGVSIPVLAKDFKVNHETIRRVVNRLTYKHVVVQ